jgi:hypothetical protein
MVAVIVVDSNFVHATLVQKHNAHAACELHKRRTHATHARTHVASIHAYHKHARMPYAYRKHTPLACMLHRILLNPVWTLHASSQHAAFMVCACHTYAACTPHACCTHAARTLTIPFLHATCRAHACRTNAEHTPHHTSHTCRMHATLLVHTPCTQTLDMP